MLERRLRRYCHEYAATIWADRGRALFEEVTTEIASIIHHFIDRAESAASRSIHAVKGSTRPVVYRT
jgi:hypothetical protein